MASHHFRYWRTYPEKPTPVERRRSSRAVAVCLAVAILLCMAAISILFAFVLGLRASRNEEAVIHQEAIDARFCHVLAQLPAANPELARIRTDLHCKEPGLTPDQVRQVNETGGTP